MQARSKREAGPGRLPTRRTGNAVFDTGVRQFRMAMGLVRGRRLSTRNVERLVEDALATLGEFGEPGADASALIEGPFSDPTARTEFATANLRRTARRLSRMSPFYSRHLAAAQVRPDRLDVEGLQAVPVTVKSDLAQRAAQFRCVDVPGYLTTRTTGTTGSPVEIWLSRYEMELWPAIGALTAVLRGDVLPSDVMQVNISSRATAAVSLDVAACRLIGSGCRLLGVIPVDESLEELCSTGASLLSTVPSYLAELTSAAQRMGLGPDDFQLRRIDVAGEVLSPALSQAAAKTFGVPAINDLFGMTEVLPVTGRTCSHGHLHHDINTGHVEYVDLDSGGPAAPGAMASVVITPYFPYRDCMPVFRYDTRDVVRPLPDDGLSCEISALPATSKVLGKADQLLRVGTKVVATPRQLVEAIEALPTHPWPARFCAVPDGGRTSLTLPVSALTGISQADAVAHFATCGLDVRLKLVADHQARQLRPLRCDLRETTFSPTLTRIGA
jgi:phenylacetate-CoA ligase